MIGRVGIVVLAAVATVLAGIFLATPDGTGLFQPLDVAIANGMRISRTTRLGDAVTTLSLLAPLVLAIGGGVHIWHVRRRVVGALLPAAALSAAYVISALPALIVSRPGPRGAASRRP